MGLWDSITGTAGDIFGGIGDAANALGGWAKDNESGALLLGGTIAAGAKYMTQASADKAAAKRDKESFNREAQRYDELHQVADLNWQNPTMDAGTLAGNAPLTSNGLLTQMQQTPVDNDKLKMGV